MSRSSVFAIRADGLVDHVGDALNSWGTAAMIWSALAKKYNVHDPLSWGRDRPEVEPMWTLHNTHPLDEVERAALLFTFDRAYARTSNIPKLSAALREFYRRHGAGLVDTAVRVADILDAVQADPGIRGVCFQMTSVSENPWSIRDGEDCRMFVFGKDINPDVFEIFDEPLTESEFQHGHEPPEAIPIELDRGVREVSMEPTDLDPPLTHESAWFRNRTVPDAAVMAQWSGRADTLTYPQRARLDTEIRRVLGVAEHLAGPSHRFASNNYSTAIPAESIESRARSVLAAYGAVEGAVAASPAVDADWELCRRVVHAARILTGPDGTPWGKMLAAGYVLEIEFPVEGP